MLSAVVVSVPEIFQHRLPCVCTGGPVQLIADFEDASAESPGGNKNHGWWFAVEA